MGEEDIKYYYSRAATHVFWNLEDYPIPADGIDSIDLNTKLAFHRMGFHGWVGLLAYGGKPRLDERGLVKAGICYTPIGNEDSTLDEMSLDIIEYVAGGHPDPKNIAVIAKLDPESEFYRVLKCLKSRNHTVLLVDPPPHDTTAETSLFHSVDSVIYATKDLHGGKPRSGKPQSGITTPADTVPNDDEEDDEQDYSVCCYICE